MSETLGRLNRTIEAQGPDSLLVAARDELASAYQTIGALHDQIGELETLAQIRLTRLMEALDKPFGPLDEARLAVERETSYWSGPGCEDDDRD